MPDASLSGDAIVGFPGETEEQFEATVTLVREVGFDRVNTAAYSPRPNTPAATWPNQVHCSCGLKEACVTFSVQVQRHAAGELAFASKAFVRVSQLAGLVNRRSHIL